MYLARRQYVLYLHPGIHLPSPFAPRASPHLPQWTWSEPQTDPQQDLFRRPICESKEDAKSDGNRKVGLCLKKSGPRDHKMLLFFPFTNGFWDASSYFRVIPCHTYWTYWARAQMPLDRSGPEGGIIATLCNDLKRCIGDFQCHRPGKMHHVCQNQQEKGQQQHVFFYVA